MNFSPNSVLSPVARVACRRGRRAGSTCEPRVGAGLSLDVGSLCERPMVVALMKDLLARIAAVQHVAADLTDRSSCDSRHGLMLRQELVGTTEKKKVPFSPDAKQQEPFGYFSPLRLCRLSIARRHFLSALSSPTQWIN